MRPHRCWKPLSLLTERSNRLSSPISIYLIALLHHQRLETRSSPSLLSGHSKVRLGLYFPSRQSAPCDQVCERSRTASLNPMSKSTIRPASAGLRLLKSGGWLSKGQLFSLNSLKQGILKRASAGLFQQLFNRNQSHKRRREGKTHP